MTFDTYRYFYTCAFSMFDGHLFAFVDEMVELAYAESTIKIYLSCINEAVNPASPLLNCSNLIFSKKIFSLIQFLRKLSRRVMKTDGKKIPTPKAKCLLCRNDQ